MYKWKVYIRHINYGGEEKILTVEVEAVTYMQAIIKAVYFDTDRIIEVHAVILP